MNENISGYVPQPVVPRFPRSTYSSLDKEQRKLIFRQTYKDFSWVGLWIFLYLVIVNVVCLVFDAITKGTKLQENEITYTLVATLVSIHLIATPICFLCSGLRKNKPIEQHKMGAGTLSLTYLFVLFAGFSGAIIGSVVTFLIGDTSSAEQVSGMTTESAFFLRVLVVGITAPIAEELIFRKLIIDHLYRHSELFAVLFSSLMFGLFHGNFSQFFLALAIGIIFGFVYVRTGRIRYSIILHMGLNLLTSVFSASVLETENRLLTVAYSILLLALCVAGLVVFVCILTKKIRFVLHENQSFASNLVPAFCNVFVILFVALCIIMFIISVKG